MPSSAKTLKRGTLNHPATPKFVRALAATTLLLPATALAIGVRIPNQDPAAIARANAFVATADNPAAIYYNPAGITQLEGQELQVGVLNYMGINTSYEAAGGGKTRSEFEVLPIPQLYYTCTPDDSRLSYGLGLYAPFGLAVEWPEDSGFRSIAIESRLTYLTLNPVLAWKLSPTLSIAAGPNLNYAEIEFTRGLFTATDVYNFKGDDFGSGLNFGIRWQPSEEWAFGFSYRTASRINFEGASTYRNSPFPFPVADSSTTATIDFPQVITAGVSYRPTPEWNLEFNVDYTEWNSLNTVTLEGTAAMFGLVTGGADLPLQLEWQESWQFALGATRQLDDGWFVSGGYFYSSATAPRQTFTPAIPDTALHVASLGLGRQGEQWRWVVASQFAMGPNRNISGTAPSPAGESANGKYQLIVPTVSLSISRRF